MNIQPWMKIEEGKNPDRVKIPAKYQKVWQAAYDILLMDGKTCADCFYCRKCTSIFGGNPEDTMCQFFPNRYLGLERKGSTDKPRITK